MICKPPRSPLYRIRPRVEILLVVIFSVSAAGGAAAVRVAGAAGAGRVLCALVPAGALGDLLWGLAGVVNGVIHIANRASNLVGLHVAEACEEVLAV